MELSAVKARTPYTIYTKLALKDKLFSHQPAAICLILIPAPVSPPHSAPSSAVTPSHCDEERNGDRYRRRDNGPDRDAELDLVPEVPPPESSRLLAEGVGARSEGLGLTREALEVFLSVQNHLHVLLHDGPHVADLVVQLVDLPLRVGVVQLPPQHGLHRLMERHHHLLRPCGVHSN